MICTKIDKTIAIAALARDCASALICNIPKIETLRSYFTSSIVVVVENDSKDGTKEVLHDWESRSENVVVLSEDYHSDTIPPKSADGPFPGASKYRIERLSKYRNIYMTYLRKTAFDYLLIIDIDIDDFEPDNVIYAINKAPEDWTALFANGQSYIHLLKKRICVSYYDDYAYVPYPAKGEPVIELTLTEVKKNKAILSKKLKNNNFIKCISSFGGIGIYKYGYVKNLTYCVLPNSRSNFFEVLCEHIPFNVSLSQYGSNYIAKDILIYHSCIKTIKKLFLEILPLKIRIALFIIKSKGVV